MNNYGETFRILRKERGFTLKSVSDKIVSLSYLSKFERGESEITLTNLTRLLERLNITLDEFYNFNEIKISYYVALLTNVADAYARKDLDTLIGYYNQEVERYEQSSNIYDRCNYIMVGSIIRYIDPEFYISQKDIDFYVDYLFKCSYWTTYEVSLFGNGLRLFNEQSLLFLLNDIETKLKRFRVIRKNVRDLISLIENACLILLREEYIESAKKLSQFLEEYLAPNHYFEKTRKLFIDGIILICEGEVDEGVLKARQAIDIIQILEDSSVNDYQLELELFLKKRYQ